MAVFVFFFVFKFGSFGTNYVNMVKIKPTLSQFATKKCRPGNLVFRKIWLIPILLVVTETACVKDGHPTGKRAFDLYNIARPSQQQLSSCVLMWLYKCDDDDDCCCCCCYLRCTMDHEHLKRFNSSRASCFICYKPVILTRTGSTRTKIRTKPSIFYFIYNLPM